MIHNMIVAITQVAGMGSEELLWRMKFRAHVKLYFPHKKTIYDISK
jgi:hypothetical protein